jgi:hypothetical protein
LLDKDVFLLVGEFITHYALDISIWEWSTTKRLEDQIIEDEMAFDRIYKLPFTLGLECKLGYELPLRYSLPCKHWLYKALVEEVPIPLSLFHP